MKISALVSWLFFAAALLLAGCASRPVNPASVERDIQDYSRTWKAVEEVMSRHFLIRYSDRWEGTIVSAPIRSDGRMANAKTIVRARILASKDGGYDVEVRAENYIETTGSPPVSISASKHGFSGKSTSCALTESSPRIETRSSNRPMSRTNCRSRGKRSGFWVLGSGF